MEELRREHVAIGDHLQELIDLLASPAGAAAARGRVRQAVPQLIEESDRHCCREDHLMFEAYLAGIGGD